MAVLLGMENILIKETKRVKKGQILISLTLTQGLFYKSSKNSFWLYLIETYPKNDRKFFLIGLPFDESVTVKVWSLCKK